MYIFLDESGDLGFSGKSSKWFSVTIAIVKDERSLERVVKKVWKSLRKKHKHIGELHASHEKDLTRIKMLKLLSTLDDLKIMSVVLNKNKVYLNLRTQKVYLYNFAANLVLDRIYNKEILHINETIDLVADRKDTKKSLTENFVQHLTKSMNGRSVKMFKIRLHASYENKSLQAVDFLSWAIYQKYEHKNMCFYEIIKDKIVDEKLIFE